LISQTVDGTSPKLGILIGAKFVNDEME